jgi:murein DD-endopeptidase MepM/ murein hydrolase activator NlpD
MRSSSWAPSRPTIRAAAVPDSSDVARLEAENAKVRELAAALDSAERRYGRLREMVGADIVPDPVTLAYQLPVAPVLRAQAPGRPGRFESGASVPSHWPLDVPGYVTRGQVLAGSSEEEHAGLDVAVPLGSIVRAAGGGSVREADLDPQYGEFVLLEHPEGYQTMYGHLSRVVVRPASTSSPEGCWRSGASGRRAPTFTLKSARAGVRRSPR